MSFLRNRLPISTFSRPAFQFSEHSNEFLVKQASEKAELIKYQAECNAKQEKIEQGKNISQDFLLDCAQKLFFSNLMVSVSTSTKISEGPVSLLSLREKAISANRALILCFLPKVFKTWKEVPYGWDDIEGGAACGGGPLAEILNDVHDDLQADIYLVTKQSSSYQGGVDGLLAKRGLNKISIISDESHAIEKTCGFPVFDIFGEKLFRKFCIMLLPNLEYITYPMSGPINSSTITDFVGFIADARFLTKTRDITDDLKNTFARAKEKTRNLEGRPSLAALLSQSIQTVLGSIAESKKQTSVSSASQESAPTPGLGK